MTRRQLIAQVLANALLAGPWIPSAMKARIVEAIGSCPRWVHPAIRRSYQRFPTAPLDRRDRLARCLLEGKAFGKGIPPDGLRRWLIYAPAMGATRWDVRRVATLGDLATWLAVEGPELDWFADRKGLERFVRDERLRHYRYSWMEKRSGGLRLIETPKPQLKAIQRRLLRGILDHIPPHEAAHGFRAGRSVVSFAAPHAGRAVVLKLDLSNFFASISSARVLGVFRTAGYPEDVARALTALCCNRAPQAVLRESEVSWHERRSLSAPHLPQGAPTSPALANLCAYRLDVRLSALAVEARGRYTRYADDLAFSFDELPSADRFLTLASTVALEEGFAVNFRKTRRLRGGARQRLAGVVVNAHPNVPREEFDWLKAVLHNCRRWGPSTQHRDGVPNLRAQLTGHVAWVTMVNPQRGARLRAMLGEIDWLS